MALPAETAAASRLELGATELSLRAEELSVRGCRRCDWVAPAYLENCRHCPAVLGEPYRREIVVVVPEL